MSKEDIGTDYVRSSHDSYVHRQRCPLMEGVLYIKGKIPLADTMFKVCHMCWPEL